VLKKLNNFTVCSKICQLAYILVSLLPQFLNTMAGTNVRVIVMETSLFVLLKEKSKVASSTFHTILRLAVELLSPQLLWLVTTVVLEKSHAPISWNALKTF